MASGAASGPTETPSLTLERNYEASPQQVWQAWTDPQALIRWFGPQETESVMKAELDVRVGGRYRTARDNHLRGWTGTFRKLDRYLQARL